jgi:hypothetical protein
MESISRSLKNESNLLESDLKTFSHLQNISISGGLLTSQVFFGKNIGGAF